MEELDINKELCNEINYSKLACDEGIDGQKFSVRTVNKPGRCWQIDCKSLDARTDKVQAKKNTLSTILVKQFRNLWTVLSTFQSSFEDQNCIIWCQILVNTK